MGSGQEWANGQIDSSGVNFCNQCGGYALLKGACCARCGKHIFKPINTLELDADASAMAEVERTSRQKA